MSSPLVYIILGNAINIYTGTPNTLPTLNNSIQSLNQPMVELDRRIIQTVLQTVSTNSTWIWGINQTLNQPTVKPDLQTTGKALEQLPATSTQAPNIEESLNRTTTYAPDNTTRRPGYRYTPGIGAHKFNTQRMPWNKAWRACEQDGAHLAIINSAAEADAIAHLLFEGNSLEGYIGAHDLYEEGLFVTIHGELLSDIGYNGWNNGEPNNAGKTEPNENCVEISIFRKFNDVPCGDLKPFICELPHVQ